MIELNVQTKVETKQAEDNLNKVEDKAKESEKAIDGMTGAIDKFTGGAVTAFRKFTAGVKTGVLAMKTLRGAIIATGVGALVVAVSSLFSYFNKTQRGADTLNQVFKAIGTTIDVLIDRVSTFGEGLFKIITGDFSTGIDILKGSISGIVDEIKNESSASLQLEKDMQKLRDQEIEFIKVKAEKRRIIEAARLAAEDETLTDTERADALREAIAAQNELTDQEIEFQKERARIIRERVALGESMASDLEEQANAEARVIELEAERDRSLKRVQTRLNSFTKDTKDNTKATEKNAEAQQKAAEEAQKKADADALQKAKDEALAIENARLEAIREIDNQIREYKLENEESTLQDILAFEKAKRDIALEQADITEAEKASIELAYREKVAAATKEIETKEAKEREELEKEVQAAKLSIIDGTFALAQELAGENAEAGKAIAAAQAVYNGYLAVQQALASAPPPVNFVLAGVVGAMAAANVRKILSTNVQSASTGGMSGAGAAPSIPTEQEPRIPEFGFANQGVGNSQNARFGANRAYVVSEDISDKQALNSKLNDLQKMG